MGRARDQIEIEAQRALVRRIISSDGFAKSDRLITFLTYICDQSFGGNESELNEQKIGTEVFGRRADYDASVDGIVRPNASRLRHRLESYFEGEGANEPIRLTLPRGSYVPRFEMRCPSKQSISGDAQTAQKADDRVIAQPVPVQSISVPKFLNPWLFACCALLACLCILMLIARHRSQQSTGPAPLSHPLWTTFFPSNGQITIVPSDTGFVMWQAATRRSLNLEGYVSGNYRNEAHGADRLADIDAQDLASRRYTSFVDLLIVKGVTQLAADTRTKVNVHYARDLRADELKEGNFVLIGAPAANPWSELFDPSLNFAFAAAEAKRYTILNRKPIPGEPAQWTSDYDNPDRRVYGLVAYQPNLSGSGHVLLLEGTSMAGTACAWDFLSQDATLLPFLNSVKRKDGSIPHFQIVLECINLTGSPTKRVLLASRINDSP